MIHVTITNLCQLISPANNHFRSLISIISFCDNIHIKIWRILGYEVSLRGFSSGLLQNQGLQLLVKIWMVEKLLILNPFCCYLDLLTFLPTMVGFEFSNLCAVFSCKYLSISPNRQKFIVINLFRNSLLF